MEHAKKMMLIDASTDLRNVKMHHTALDQSISDVLNRGDVDDYVKIKLYQDALNKFLISRENVEEEFKSPLKVQVTAQRKDKDVVEKFLDSLPQEERAKASRIINDLISYTPLQWDDEGQILDSDRRPVEGSDIGKIVSHEINPSKKNIPTGFDAFVRQRENTPSSRKDKVTTKKSRRRTKRKTDIDWEFY